MLKFKKNDTVGTFFKNNQDLLERAFNCYDVFIYMKYKENNKSYYLPIYNWQYYRRHKDKQDDLYKLFTSINIINIEEYETEAISLSLSGQSSAPRKAMQYTIYLDGDQVKIFKKEKEAQAKARIK